MACATLKRTYELDPLHSRPSKRPRRCMPMGGHNPNVSPHSSGLATPPRQKPSSFPEVEPKLTSEQISQFIRDEYRRMHRRRRLWVATDSNVQQPAGTSLSPSHHGSLSPMHESSHMAGGSSPMHYGASPMHYGTLSPTHGSSSPIPGTQSPINKDKPLFSMRQVSMICERMIKERDTQVREEYDKVLSCKLAEQYDAFIRFNQDYLQRRFGETAASYVS
ncbi:PREDICTED: akirin-2-like [Branchiostoma belcheri]|uniref:Akirin-2-like n=1 Tax=Branchiostoma belcheri TaxID=7741 RepID=A0A6P4Z2P0_BRABE|nr:PREDICTED: akirin-2-like [Branchiostoma belcheri]